MVLPLSCNLMPETAVQDLVGLAVQAESLGFGRCWVYDEGLVTRDVYVTLTAIGLATERIRIGTGITNPYVRHPGATAAAVATLDELSGGRAFVGLGAGGGLTLGPLGIEAARPLTAVRETVAALRSLFAGETVDLDGESFSLCGARLGYARPDIEIILAGRGPRMTRLGGEVADGFLLSYLHKDVLGDTVSMLRSVHETDSRPFSVTYSTFIATNDLELEQARAQLTFRLIDSPQRVKDLIGMTEEDTASIRTALAGGGPGAAAHLVKEEWVPHFVIVGTPQEAGAELRSLMERYGLDEFQLPVHELDGAAAKLEQVAAMF